MAVAGAALELYGAHRVETTQGHAQRAVPQGRPGRLLRAGRALTAAGVAGALLGRRSRSCPALSGAVAAGRLGARPGSASSRAASRRRRTRSTPWCRSASGYRDSVSRPTCRGGTKQGPAVRLNSADGGRHGDGELTHPRTRAIERDPTRGRWGIVVAAVLVQLALGAVYAWSVFNKPLQSQFGWSKTEAVLPFEVAIGTIFIGSLRSAAGSRTGAARDRWRWPASSSIRVGDHAGVAGEHQGPAVAARAHLRRDGRHRPGRRRTSRRSPCSRSGSRTSAGSSPASPSAGFGFGAVITAPVAKDAARRHERQDQRLPAAGHRLPGRRRSSAPSMFRNPPAGYRGARLGAGDDRAATSPATPRLHAAARRCAPRSGTCSPAILTLNTAVRHRVHLPGRRTRPRSVAGVSAGAAATFVGAAWACSTAPAGSAGPRCPTGSAGCAAFLGMLGAAGDRVPAPAARGVRAVRRPRRRSSTCRTAAASAPCRPRRPTSSGRRTRAPSTAR